MLTIINAIDYATDHGVRVSEEYLSKVTRSKAVSLANTYIHVEIRQMGKGSRAWQVQDTAGTFNRAGAIVEAVNQITRETERLATLDE
ncbi:hypothetical protein [Enterobacter hormaechei]|uniref:hypothetical protein n=1 Tax=Enterobacter hormaechei TaxID=158836 RepID=UPI00307646BB